jgi:hypothetical protein
MKITMSKTLLPHFTFSTRFAAVLALLVASVPSALVHADPPADGAVPNIDYVDGIVGTLGDFIEQLVPIVIALGVLFFIWGLVQFIFASGDEAAKDEGKRKMIWGVIALFVIVSVWGLVALLNQLTGVDQGEARNAVYNPITGASDL